MTKTPEPERMVWTVNEFLRRNCISRPLFYRLVARGALHTIKAGGKRLIPVAAEKAWHEGSGK